MSNYLCHFEILATDTEKAKEFYAKVFDWKFKADDAMPEYTMIDTGKEPGGGLMKKPAQAPHPALSVYFYVDDIEETLRKATEAGGQIIAPKTPIPNIGFWALFADPDGIPVSIFEAEKK